MIIKKEEEEEVSHIFLTMKRIHQKKSCRYNKYQWYEKKKQISLNRYHLNDFIIRRSIEHNNCIIKKNGRKNVNPFSFEALNLPRLLHMNDLTQ